MNHTLHLNLQEKWFLSHQNNKNEEYRALTPYWCNKLLTYKGKKMRKGFWKDLIERFGGIEPMMKKLHQVKFITYEELVFSNGMKPIDILPRFTKPHYGTVIGYGKREFGAPENKKVFIIKCGLLIFNARNL
jgi:hypothetical protein